MSSEATFDDVQRAAQAQFAKQSANYGKGHILADTSDVAEAAALMRLPERAEVLDVATGGGHTGLFFAANGCQVTLGDIARPMLERAAALAAERGLNVETREHAAEVLPYPDASFDLVSCRVAAHHFSSPEAFVRESARVLKQGGWFLLIDGSVEDGQPEAEDWIHQVETLRDPSHHRFLTPGAWGGLCIKAGLTVEHSLLHPMKQPDLEWYFSAAATAPENREAVRRLIATAPQSARALFQLAEEEGKIVWWWQRLTLLARRA